MFFVLSIRADGGQGVGHFGFLLLTAKFLEFFDRNDGNIWLVVGKNNDGTKSFGFVKDLAVRFLDIGGGGGKRHKIIHICLYNRVYR